MAYLRACESCGQDASMERRVKCARCEGGVHSDCRDITRVCYGCRWLQARVNNVSTGMLTPSSAGRAPFEANQPDTVAQGLPVPPLAIPEQQGGISITERRILTEAVHLGWRIEKTSDVGFVYMLRKHGRGHMRLSFNTSGRLVHVSTQRQYLTPTTARVLAHLEGK